MRNAFCFSGAFDVVRNIADGRGGAVSAQVRVAIAVGPPVLPVYEQPICPATVISGHLDTGIMTTMPPTITGYRALGDGSGSRLPVDPSYWVGAAPGFFL